MVTVTAPSFIALHHRRKLRVISSSCLFQNYKSKHKNYKRKHRESGKHLQRGGKRRR